MQYFTEIMKLNEISMSFSYVGRIKETEAFQLNSVIKALIITLRKSLYVLNYTVQQYCYRIYIQRGTEN